MRSLLIGTASALIAAGALAGQTTNVMLTGYWPPTNEMIRPFSSNADQNPDGWIGENWEGRGYNVYSFFPEYPEGSWPIGKGDFEVDYQDTSADWARITEELNPVAIITFSRGNDGKDWELENKQRNLRTWVADYRAPYQPTKRPPDDSKPAGYVRYSSLPMDDIVKDVKDSGLDVQPYIDKNGFGGGFLSEYIAYHGTWYRDEHVDESNDYRCVAGGHVHVGTNVATDVGFEATKITLRSVLDYVDTQIPEPSAALLLLIAGVLSRRSLRL